VIIDTFAVIAILRREPEAAEMLLAQLPMEITPFTAEHAALAAEGWRRYGKGDIRRDSTSATASPMRWRKAATKLCCSGAATSPRPM
jgi:uncharacterized protein with PIN domain